MSEKELSPLARQLLGGSGHVKFFTQQEFDEALALAKGEIMMVAIETTKRAIMIEREECAKVCENFRPELKSRKEYITLTEAAELIRNRIPSQRQ